MGYQVGRSKRIEETLDLVDSEGIVQHTVPVALNTSDIARQYRAQYLHLIKVQQAYAALRQAQGEEKAEALEMRVSSRFSAFTMAAILRCWKTSCPS